MSDLAVVTLACVAMEGITYLLHRFVMHGFGMRIHRSHHRARTSTFEANDLYPVAMAAVTVLATTAGASLPSLHLLFLAGVGVSLYGAAYLFVHDVYIHARLGPLPQVAVLEHLKRAHAVHHLYGGEPYGMLVPVVPRRLRERAARAAADPVAPGANGPLLRLARD